MTSLSSDGIIRQRTDTILQDPGICCRMSDPKLPLGEHVLGSDLITVVPTGHLRTQNFRRSPHMDQTFYRIVYKGPLRVLILHGSKTHRGITLLIRDQKLESEIDVRVDLERRSSGPNCR